MKKVAHVLNRLSVKPDAIISSPYLRARQTAEILAKELKYKKDKIELSERLSPASQPEPMIEEIIEKYIVEELVIVGHEPCFGLLISALAAGDPDLAINVRYGSVCCLSADDFRIERRATFEWLLTPKISQKYKACKMPETVSLSPELFIDRELSLLEFQRRVLEEALDENNPLLERVKFLSIFGSNMDEFFIVRVSGIRKQVEARITKSRRMV